MRYGFTTGSCAAAAAKAAAYMLLTGRDKQEIVIETPKGIAFAALITDICRKEQMVSCAVVKDGGDDPDVTTGARIVAEVSLCTGNTITIDGGFGVGRVTKPGLDQPVGAAAINHVPREMILKEVTEVCQMTDYQGGLQVIISVPEGLALAGQTFNPRLGIEGGISILGTSGIVEPMSRQALIDTIAVELRQKKAEGYEIAAVSPGNYGLDYMKNTYGYELDKSVKCSNFIGETIDLAVSMGFRKMLLTGHIGKLVKIAGGIMNTHSREGDGRMAFVVAAGVACDVPMDVLKSILDAVTTEEAVRLLAECGKKEAVMAKLMEQIQYYLNKRGNGKIEIETIMYDNRFGELAKSSRAVSFLNRLKEY